MSGIFQQSLPFAPWMEAHTWRLPGTVPIDPADWLVRDEVYPEQMASRDRLIATVPAEVHAMTEGCRPAACALLDLVLAQLGPDFRAAGMGLRRPDGVVVPLDGDPLITVGRLAQEDFVILEKPDGAEEHVMTGAIVCFPANWTLAEKFGKGLARIHLPVAQYDATIARRVQRLFDSIRPDQVLMRANLLIHGESALHSPRPEFAPRAAPPGDERFLRVERQTFRRLARGGAVVFGIHTYVLRPGALTPEQRARLEALRPGALEPGDSAGETTRDGP